MPKLQCLFILSLFFVASAHAQEKDERALFTPAVFRSILKEIKKSESGSSSPYPVDYKTVDQEGEAALAFVTGLQQKEVGDFDAAKKSLSSAREILDTLMQQPTFKSLYAFSRQDVVKETWRVLDDEFLSTPLADQKAIDESLKNKKPLLLSYYNGRAFAGASETDEKQFRVDSILTFCKQVRTVYPNQTYKFAGKILKIEYLKASFGSKVVYDNCDAKSAAKLEKRRRDSDVSELDGSTPGWSGSASFFPQSVVGPLFSYSVWHHAVDTRDNSSSTYHTYDLSRLRPAKFDDWFEPNSLNLPCPQKAEEAGETNRKNLHCSPAAKVKRDQFSIVGFADDFTTAKLKIFVENFSYDRQDYYTQSNGTAKPKPAFLKLLKSVSKKEFLFDTSKD